MMTVDMLDGEGEGEGEETNPAWLPRSVKSEDESSQATCCEPERIQGSCAPEAREG